MEFTVSAKLRSESGSSAAKKIRARGKVPGIVYGNGPSRMIELDHDELHRDMAYESFHSSILKLEIDGDAVSALLRDVQSHPIADRILHVDFQAIAENAEIWMTIPLHFVNSENAPGVKLKHGIFSVTESSVGVHCLPKDLPESISIDVGHLDLNQSVHLSEVAAPEGVSFDALTRGDDPSLATVLAPKVEVEEPVAAAETAEETPEESETEQEDS